MTKDNIPFRVKGAISLAFELKAGDIIYSGTPENVGPVVKGDVLLCKLEGLPDMSIRIT